MSYRRTPGRPPGQIRQALLDELLSRPQTVKAAARERRIAMGIARKTASILVAAGEVMPVGRDGRAAMLGAPFCPWPEPQRQAARDLQQAMRAMVTAGRR